MARVTEDQMKDYILNKQSFMGSSVRAVRNNDDYCIYSYDTLIYRESDNYFDNSKYSSTTSKIQNMIIDCFGLNDGIQKRH